MRGGDEQRCDSTTTSNHVTTPRRRVTALRQPPAHVHLQPNYYWPRRRRARRQILNSLLYDPFVRLSVVERKALDILSDRLFNLIVLMCLWSSLPFRQNCKKVGNQRCTIFTTSKSNSPQTENKATGHHFKYVRPKSRHRIFCRNCCKLI